MKKFSLKNIIIAIILIGIIIRVIYVIKTPYMEKQHDIEPQGNGLSYIMEIYEKGKLPQDNDDQHYHPPFSQLIAAGWMKIGSLFTQNVEVLYESLQFLQVIYSVILILIVYKILKELKINDKLKVLVLLVIAFHPTLIILSGSINNDNLCFVLMIWAILWLIKWYKKSNIKNIVILAILTGLSVMTKTSGAMLAIPIVYIFIFKLYKEIRKSPNKKIIIKNYIFMFIIFGIISLPLGLWYSIRNYILFEQPILYVYDPKNINLWVGDYNLFERFFPFSNELVTFYCNPWQDHNIPIYLIKCSLFGEYGWGTSFIYQILYSISLWINIILIVVTLIFMVRAIKNKSKRNKIWVNALFLFSLFNFISYVIMNIKLPYGCSMDFRYLLVTLFIGVMFICFDLQNIKINKQKLFNKLYKDIIKLSLILFISSDIIIIFS